MTILEELEKIKFTEFKPKELAYFIQNKIDKAVKKTQKAFGGCLNCYGKGYYTYRQGLRGSGDFEGEKDFQDPIITHVGYCSCSRGTQLQELVQTKIIKSVEK